MAYIVDLEVIGILHQRDVVSLCYGYWSVCRDTEDKSESAVGYCWPCGNVLCWDGALENMGWKEGSKSTEQILVLTNPFIIRCLALCCTFWTQDLKHTRKLSCLFPPSNDSLNSVIYFICLFIYLCYSLVLFYITSQGFKKCSSSESDNHVTLSDQ